MKNNQSISSSSEQSCVMTNDELLSKTINYMRFPLMVGVVFIHNKMGEIDIQGSKVSYDAWPWLSFIMDFFSSVLPAISVPLFFFISGFLFFYCVDFNKDVYKRKIKSRCKTLLIPYLIWNFIAFLVLLIQMHPRFLSLFPLLKDYRIDITEFLSYFWMKKLPMDPPGDYIFPLNFPFWFIRDLMILVVLTPIIYWLIKKLKFIFVIIITAVWFFHLGQYVGFPGLCHQSICFFPLGAYFSINRINFVALANKAKWCPYVYLVFAIADTVTLGEPYNFWFHGLGIMTGLVSVTYIVSVLLYNRKVRINQFLSNASFFVFAAHGLLISKFMKAIVMLVHPQSPYLVLFIYFFVPITTILICLGLYKLLNRYTPVVANILIGK